MQGTAPPKLIVGARSLCRMPKLSDDRENQEVEQFDELFILYSFIRCAYNAVQQVSKRKIKNQNDGCCLMKGSSSLLLRLIQL